MTISGTPVASSLAPAAAPAPTHGDAATVAPAAALYRALGEPTRLLIVQHLFSGEHRVRELTDHLGLAQSTVSAHLACLRECGLVRSRAEGRSSLFSLADPDRLASLLTATEGVLEASGSAVTLCPHLEAEAPGVERLGTDAQRRTA